MTSIVACGGFIGNNVISRAEQLGLSSQLKVITEKISSYVPGKSWREVRKHYEDLVYDVLKEELVEAVKALANPYFKGLAKVEREPSCQPITKLEFEFERRRVTKEDVRELLYREILEYHPQLLKDYLNGNESTNFLYPSAIGQFRKQFAYLEENCGRSAPVIPLERKHVSLPWSIVHSNTIPPNMHSNSTSFDNRQVTEDASKNLRVQDISYRNPAKVARPLPRMPSAKPGRVVGSVVPYENGRNIKDLNDARMFCRNAALPPQTTSQQCFFRTNTLIQEKSIAEAEKDSQTKQQPPQCNVVAKKSYGMAMDVNTNPYYQPQTRKPRKTSLHVVMWWPRHPMCLGSGFDLIGCGFRAFGRTQLLSRLDVPKKHLYKTAPSKDLSKLKRRPTVSDQETLHCPL
ncbi:hypothetical protein DKX38_015466 [Salix brachista]|uniref:Uncharacterized protein n=1 Tax=Salix brachista TaxID=2182728 RepID=A0A5N5L5A8_9ROSI|nr:hypothetical protein DKX38_015466 [Salix brachista]